MEPPERSAGIITWSRRKDFEDAKRGLVASDPNLIVPNAGPFSTLPQY
jgi:hypothetical protein